MDATLNRLKSDLKHWEACFEKFYQRKPTKEDIKITDPTIRSMYREYYKLKTIGDESDNICTARPNTSQKHLDDLKRLSSIIKPSTCYIGTPNKILLPENINNIDTYSDSRAMVLQAKLKDWHIAKNSLKSLDKNNEPKRSIRCENNLNTSIIPMDIVQITKILDDPNQETIVVNEVVDDYSDDNSNDSYCNDDDNSKSRNYELLLDTNQSGIKKNNSVMLSCENFVKIDLKKKKFQRKSRFNHIHYARQKRRNFWKKKSYNFFNNDNTCNVTYKKPHFQCHSYLDWVDPIDSQNDLISTFDNEEINDSMLSYEQFKSHLLNCYDLDIPTKGSLSFLTKDICVTLKERNFLNWNIDELELILEENLKIYGFKTFRPKQKETCVRILKGETTLLVQQTGSGKSLCYQLPAMIYHKYFNSTTIVVSPLISLMEDQVNSLPSCIKGVHINHYMESDVRKMILNDLANGLYDIIYISPELLMTCTYILETIPCISFVCIDEAHCLSKYSHNFRPAYLFICDLIKKTRDFGCFLGVTATATLHAIRDILDHLNPSVASNYNGLSTTCVNYNQYLFEIPKNLNFTVINTKDKNQELLKIIEKHININGNNREYGATIIYCSRRDTTEIVSSYLRTYLTWNNIDGSTAHQHQDIIIDHYHAGMHKKARNAVQNRFMRNKCKIVAATSAFGMGLNKKDVRVIIHYDYPLCFESFVQEVGRAGRDDLPAFSYVISDFENIKDVNQVLKHVYAQSIDKLALKKIVQHIFPSKTHSSIDNNNNFHRLFVHKILMDNVVQECNQNETIILTIFYLTRGFFRERNFTTIPNVIGLNKPSSIILNIYSNFEDLLKLCVEDQFLASIFMESTKNSNENVLSLDILCYLEKYCDSIEFGYYRFIGHIHKCLSKQRDISYEFVDEAVVIETFINLDSQLMDDMIEYLFKHIKTYEKEQIMSRLSLIQLLYSMSQTESTEQSNLLFVSCVKNYFTNVDIESFKSWFDEHITCKCQIKISKDPIDSQTVSKIMDSTTHLVDVYSDRKFNARSITNIFHGIDTPMFSRLEFSSDVRFWHKYLHIPYKELFNIVHSYLLNNL